MRISLFFNFDVLPSEPRPDLLAEVEAQVIAADRLGFDGIWLAEHHFQEYGRMPSPLLFLARLSALTTRISLGTAVVETPYYHPLRLAEDAALLDRLSGGRLKLGLGSGAGNKPGEFAHFGVPLTEKSQRQIEISEILVQALAGVRVSWSGEYFQIEDVTIEPQPIQSPSAMLAMAAGTLGTAFAARHALPLLLPRAAPDEKVQEMISAYRAALPTGQPGQVVPLRFFFVAETEAEARAATEVAFQRYAQYDAGVAWDGRYDTAEYDAVRQRIKFSIGTPDQVATQLNEWVDDVDATEIMGQTFVAGISHESALRSMELFASEVLPRFHAVDRTLS